MPVALAEPQSLLFFSKQILKAPIELKYNASDEYVLDKMKKEVTYLLHASHKKLHSVGHGQPVTSLDACWEYEIAGCPE